MRNTAGNARIKHEYVTFLEECKGLSPPSVDGAVKALARFETYSGYRDFRKFDRRQAIGFKKHLAEQLNLRTRERLSKATVYSTLGALKAFFQWLAGQPGYKSHLQYPDAEYFSLSRKETAIAKATREPRVPTLEEIRSVLNAMPNGTPNEKRDRSVVAFAILTGARDNAIASMLLKHVDLTEGVVHHDARDVRVKFSKSFPTYFFEVGDDIRQIVIDWVAFITAELGFGLNDPLFPSTRVSVNESGNLAPAGLLRENWASAGPIRAIFKAAFARAGLPYYNPHSFRKTLARLGMERCQGDGERFRAWSQNLGHNDVLTTFTSYGVLPAHRQRDLIRSSTEISDDDRVALELGRAALAAARWTGTSPGKT